eukprot:TRINITY_DN33666_c0_g1_i1.p1 TRINITY_DN33666_c0_g1~~TRINITY_DN33666_c0_g1_i1.p1  ORF type:complete len:236 (+),score=55.22 TRINITY_DN33666_c0_g1_i1:54-710(+)
MEAERKSMELLGVGERVLRGEERKSQSYEELVGELAYKEVNKELAEESEPVHGLHRTHKGTLNQALVYFRSALTLYEHESSQDPSEPPSHALALIYYNIGRALGDLGNLSESMEYLSRALSLFSKVQNNHSGSEALAEAKMCFALVAFRDSQFIISQRHFQDAAAILKKKQLKTPEARNRYASCLRYISLCRVSMGRNPEKSADKAEYLNLQLFTSML